MTFTKHNRKASKLTAEQVLEIRALYTMRGVTQPMLARQFGVSGTTISNIVNGVTWQGVVEEMNGPVLNHPPPRGAAVQPTDEEIARSVARLREKLNAQGVPPPGVSWYDLPPPADPEADAAAQRAQAKLASEVSKHVGTMAGQVGESLDELLSNSKGD